MSERKTRAAEKIRLTENQLKVIRDKYLRDARSVESWLDGVARNVALAEVVLHPKAEEWGVFEGVEREVVPVAAAGPAPAARILLYHQGFAEYEGRQANFRRLIANLEKVCA